MLILFLLTFHLKRLMKIPDTLFKNTERVKGLSNIKFKQLLSPATKESYFVFMRSSTNRLMELLLGLALAISFSCILWKEKKVKHLQLLSTANLPLVEFIHTLTDFCHLPISLALFTRSLVDDSEYTQVGLNYILN